MTKAQKIDLFIATCLTEKDLAVLSLPIMNTAHSKWFDIFCKGLELSDDL